MLKKIILTFAFAVLSFVLNANQGNIKSQIPPYNEEFNNIYQALSGKSTTDEKIQAVKTLRTISQKENGRYYILSLRLLEKTIQSTRDPLVFTESLRFLSTRTDKEIKQEKNNNFTFFIDKKISNIDLSNINLRYIDFSNANFENVNFANSNFENVFFNGARLKKINFTGSTFNKTTFNNSKLEQVLFTQSNFSTVNMGVSQMKNVNFTGSVFVKTILKGSTIDNSNFSSSKIQDSAFNYTKFSRNTKFNEAVFKNVDLSYSNIEGTEGITEEMLKGSYIIKGDKQPIMPSYLKDLSINIRDKDLNTVAEQSVTVK